MDWFGILPNLQWAPNGSPDLLLELGHFAKELWGRNPFWERFVRAGRIGSFEDC